MNLYHIQYRFLYLENLSSNNLLYHFFDFFTVIIIYCFTFVKFPTFFQKSRGKRFSDLLNNKRTEKVALKR